MNDAAGTTTCAIIVVMIILGAAFLVVDGENNEEFRAQVAQVAQQNRAAKSAEWRNAFWERVALPSNGTETPDQLPLLAECMRELFLSPEGVRLDAEKWNSIGKGLLEEDSLNASYGIFSKGWLLTDESARRIGCIQTGAECEPEVIPPKIDPAIKKSVDIFYWEPWVFFWVLASIAGYLYMRFQMKADKMLGIMDYGENYSCRTVLAIAYAPELLIVLVYLLLKIGLAATIAASRRIRSRISDFRNPYRMEIRAAERALAVLRAEGATPDAIESAEEILAFLRKRHENESNEQRSEEERRLHAARLEEARDTLLRLSARVQVEKIRSRSS